MAQSTMPQIVGSRKESAVHFILFVSLRMVSSVVVQGKCSSVNIIVLIAVRSVQPFACNIGAILDVSSRFTSVPVCK